MFVNKAEGITSSESIARATLMCTINGVIRPAIRLVPSRLTYDEILFSR